jgi:hypothetical protein
MTDIIPLFNFDQPAAQPAEQVPLASAVVRNNFNSLATTNWTTDAAYPANPREGMQRILDEGGAGTNIKWQIYRGGSWQTVMQHLELGLTLTVRREFEFSTATATWLMDHNLGVRPLVQVFDAADDMLVPTNIKHVQTAGEWNRVIVTHGAVQTGYAILIG